MRFLYTGAEAANQTQNDPEKSLGGKISSSVIPNNAISNLFSDVSSLASREGLSEVRGIILKNTTDAAILNLYFHQEYEATYRKCKFEWAPITIPDKVTMESIPNGKSEPYNIGEWLEPINDAGKVLLVEEFPIDGVIGFWVKRTVLTPDPVLAIPDKELKSYLSGLNKTESLKVVLTYD